MSRKSSVAIWAATALLLSAMGCGPSADLKRQLNEMNAVSAEKDSLLVLVADNARVLSEIGAEVIRFKSPAAAAASAEGFTQVDPDELLTDIRGLTARISEAEDRLRRSQERVNALTRDNTRLQESLADFEKAVLDFQSTIASQKETMAALTTELDTVREKNTQLVTENATLAQEKTLLVDTLTAVTARDNTVYYVVGTKAELKERGLIEETGGSRALFVFGRRGKTVVPARNLDPAQFTAIDKRNVLEIPMPWADRTYTIATRQDMTALTVPPDEQGRFTGSLQIADPDRFWAASRFLIIIES